MILLSHATGLSQTQLFTRENDEIDCGVFFELITRRANYEPVEYITGKANFYSLEFIVSPDCLIPRPETELLIDMVRAEVGGKDACVIADVCTGSGAIAVTLAKELSGARLFASDISTSALEVAKKNAAKHGVHDRITFANVDLLDGLSACDIIVSNPPYIADNFALPNPVKFEPSLALFSGIDGADILRRLITQFDKHATKVLFCEFGYDQRDIVQNFCQNFSFSTLQFYKDYAGLDRGFVIRK